MAEQKQATHTRKITVMVNGLPGKMATELATKLIESEKYKVLPYSLTGPELDTGFSIVNGFGMMLVTPNEREEFVDSFLKSEKPDISIDYTHPSAVNANADFYCKHGLNFVMGTTGGDRTLLEQTVVNSNIVAVIAQNMAKQIVAFQAMMKFAAENFPDVFKGYSLEIIESHQKTKADTSGTAKSLVGYFNTLGVPFNVDQITKIRKVPDQLKMGVPENALNGHGWHTYDLRSPDRSVLISFTHNVNGRDVYLAGTIDALEYLSQKIALGERGKVYSMMDVLKGK
jgi:4-hydroxy-tetrahydrodipicolinate reductase